VLSTQGAPRKEPGVTAVNERLWRDIVHNVRLPQTAGRPAWLGELEAAELTNGQLKVIVPDEMKRQWLDRFAHQAFTEAAQVATGRLVTILFCAAGATAQEPARRATPRAAAGGLVADPYYAPLHLNPDYRFGTFVVGPCNRLAHAASLAVAERPGRAYNPLFLHGGVGLGKTHLLQAICASLLAERPQRVILYLSCEEFVNQFIQAVQAAELGRFRNRYRHVDILVIDDVHFLANKERTQEEFFHTFNTLYQQQKQIILSSDSPPAELPNLTQRLTSRFASGLVARLDTPSFETRVAILQKKAELRNLTIPQEVVNFVAERVQSSPRELEGAITTLMGLAMLNQGQIGLHAVRQAFSDGRERSHRPLSISDIMEVVAERFEVRISDLQGKRRPKSIALPRQICMHLARELTESSLEEIGGYFGGRDHTTVLHADRQIRRLRQRDPRSEALIQSLLRELSEN
jgi:chromosomal replication initiator protein